MIIKEAELVRTAVNDRQYPQDDLPEIALAGRSNVGKSSFINRLVNRKGLARTSSQPGKTRTLNFYEINQAFRIVDVPGYGYARVSKSDRQKWQAMNERFLSQRDQLVLLILLMDMRHAPTELDQAMYHFAEGLDLPFAICLTKLDKVKKSQRAKQLKLYKQVLDLPTTDALFPFSAETGEGQDDIWDMIQSLVEP